MKIRDGFVSNSSSSSFIVAASPEASKVFDIIAKATGGTDSDMGIYVYAHVPDKSYCNDETETRAIKFRIENLPEGAKSFVISAPYGSEEGVADVLERLKKAKHILFYEADED